MDTDITTQKIKQAEQRFQDKFQNVFLSGGDTHSSNKLKDFENKQITTVPIFSRNSLKFGQSSGLTS